MYKLSLIWLSICWWFVWILIQDNSILLQDDSILFTTYILVDSSENYEDNIVTTNKLLTRLGSSFSRRKRAVSYNGKSVVVTLGEPELWVMAKCKYWKVITCK